MDRGRDTDGQGQGHRWTGAGTQMDRGRDTDRQGQGHQGAGKGTETDKEKETDTDIDNFNGQIFKK